MATTPTSSSGSIRRLIGIQKRTLIRRIAALSEGIRQVTGTLLEDLDTSLTKSQVDEIRSLPEDRFLSDIWYLTDLRQEVVETNTKLTSLHEQVIALALSSSKEKAIMEKYIEDHGDYREDLKNCSEHLEITNMIIDTYHNVASERKIDIIRDDDGSSSSSKKQVIVQPDPNVSTDPPRPLPRTVSLSSIHPHPSHPSTHPHPQSTNPHPHPQHILHPQDNPNQCCLPHPGYANPTLYQQTAMAGRIQPPTFDGDITRFSEFKETFEALFGSLDDLSKLAILLSCLGPEPLRLVSNLRRLDRNYQTAMLLLSKEYDKKHLVKHVLLSRLRLLPPCDSEGTRLRETYLSLLEIVHQLLPEDTDDSSDILSNIILSKLPPALQCAVFIQNKEKPIRVMEILTMVGYEVEKERIESAIMKGSTSTHRADSPHRSDTSTRSLPERMRTSTSSPFCRLCHQNGHYPDQCTSYPTLRDRQTVVIQRKLCRRCLGSNHCTDDCRTRRLCRTCNGQHHTAICEGPLPMPSTASTSTKQPPAPVIPAPPQKNSKSHQPKNGDRAPAHEICNLAISHADDYLRYMQLRDGYL